MKKNRTKIQMVLTALVILSVVRQFFLGNYHNMFLGILTLILFMVPQFLDRKLNVTIPPGLETVILIFIFSYGPMYGIQIAFRDYIATKGISGSTWVGTKYFASFFKTRQFPRLLGNTIGISLYSLLASFPIPILLAISLNECGSLRFKKSAQMITYAPHFISTVVIVSIMTLMFSMKTGIVNNAIVALGGKRINFMGEARFFKSMYVWSGVWQSMGFNSILYLSALAGVDPALHEAATIDGASRVKRIWHIDIPCILPTIVITLILNTGSIMSIGYEKILLMQNNLNMSTSDVISTYVYRIGLVNAQYSLSTAVNLFNSVVNLIIITTVNAIAKRVGDTSLW